MTVLPFTATVPPDTARRPAAGLTMLPAPAVLIVLLLSVMLAPFSASAPLASVPEALAVMLAPVMTLPAPDANRAWLAIGDVPVVWMPEAMIWAPALMSIMPPPRATAPNEPRDSCVVTVPPISRTTLPPPIDCTP